MVGISQTHIQILPASRLDPGCWDTCVFAGGNGTLFATYAYLSQMADDWSGLVVGDYQAVLPLTYKSKFGIRYLATLPFVKQLGLLGNWCLTQRGAVLKAIGGFARYGDISFNYANAPMIAEKAEARPNYIIDLQQDYETIAAAYHKTLHKRLRKIHTEQRLLLCTADSLQVAGRYQDFLAAKTTLVLQKDFNRLTQLLQTVFGKEHFIPYSVKDQSGQELLFGLYAKDRHRIYNFMTAVTPEGRKQHASAFAVDQLVRQYGGTAKSFDFMGSAIPGVQDFIKSFGAVSQPYYLYHFNRLAWPLKLLKR